MADLAAIRVALAEALNTLPGLRAWPHPPDQIQTPAAIVEPERVDWRTAFNRGHEAWHFTVRILLGPVLNRAAELALDTYFGGVRDIKEAIETHVPLRDGTAAMDVFVAEARGFDAWEYSGVVYVGVEIAVEVYA